MFISFSSTSTARLICGILFSISAYTGHILSIILWLNHHYVMSVLLWILYALEKCIIFLLFKRHNFIFSNIFVTLFDFHLIDIPNIISIPKIELTSHIYDEFFQSYFYSLLIRFGIPLWLLNFNIFVTSQFHKTFPIYLQFLIFIYYALCIIHTSIATYVNFLDNRILQYDPEQDIVYVLVSISQQYYISFSQLFCIFLQTSVLFSSQSVFIMSEQPFGLNSILKILSIKLITSIINFLIRTCDPNRQCNQLCIPAIFAASFIIFQWVIDIGPFMDYGKTNKPDENVDQFLATNKQIIIIRAMQYLETAAYLYLSLNSTIDSILIKSQVSGGFVVIVSYLFLLNSIITLIHFGQNIKAYFTKSYSYFSAEKLKDINAQEIIQNSKQFIFIKINNIIQDENQNNENINNLEYDDNGSFLTQPLLRLLWEKVLTPIPAVGFKILIIFGHMCLWNEDFWFSHEFFDLYTEQLQDYQSIPPRQLSFFDINKISKKQLRILYEMLIDMLFKPGCPYYLVEKVFAINTDISEQLIRKYRIFFLNYMALQRLVKPCFGINPGLIYIDMYYD